MEPGLFFRVTSRVQCMMGTLSLYIITNIFDEIFITCAKNIVKPIKDADQE